MINIFNKPTHSDLKILYEKDGEQTLHVHRAIVCGISATINDAVSFQFDPSNGTSPVISLDFTKHQSDIVEMVFKQIYGVETPMPAELEPNLILNCIDFSDNLAAPELIKYYVNMFDMIPEINTKTAVRAYKLGVRIRNEKLCSRSVTYIAAYMDMETEGVLMQLFEHVDIILMELAVKHKLTTVEEFMIRYRLRNIDPEKGCFDAYLAAAKFNYMTRVELENISNLSGMRERAALASALHQMSTMMNGDKTSCRISFREHYDPNIPAEPIKQAKPRRIIRTDKK